MSNNQEIIEISSDLSSSSSSEAGWAHYFPSRASTSSSKPPKRKTKTPSPPREPSPPSSFEYKDSSDEEYTLEKKLPKALSAALQTAMSNLRKLPVPEKPSRRPKPPKQILGLASPRWIAMQQQAKQDHKVKPSDKGKGKKPMLKFYD